jgi:hypothetical protein
MGNGITTAMRTLSSTSVFFYLYLTLTLPIRLPLPMAQALHDFTARRQWMSLPPPATGEKGHGPCTVDSLRIELNYMHHLLAFFSPLLFLLAVFHLFSILFYLLLFFSF